MSDFTMRQLLEAGVHFGHHTRRWNPKMRSYIFGVRNGIHVLDLQQTVPMLDQALNALTAVSARGGRVLFVGTKRQAQEKILETANKCGQYYVNERWLGGMMTNWKTISKSISRLRELDALLSTEDTGLTKKEMLLMERERNKLNSSIGGIKDMGGQPDIMFVIDTNKEDLAIAEANKLGIPVIAILDSNSSPEGITYPVPGNDDALRAIDLYCDLACAAVLKGLQQEMKSSGNDVGEAEVVAEALPEVEAPKEDAKEEQAPEAEDKPAAEEKKKASA